MKSFARFSGAVLVYNLLVILWGAVVRATDSGAGCGKHWPLCGEQLIPVFAKLAVAIEYSHRVSSFLVIPLVGIMLVWAFRAFPKGHPVRAGAVSCVAFTFSEALLGAVLVLFKLVEHNASIYRVVALSGHLVNTLLLVLCLTLTTWWASGGKPLRLKGQGAVGWMLGVGIAGTILLAVSGAIAALSVTLFPSAGTLLDGLREDFSLTAHFIVRLRVLHPLLSMSVGLYLVLISGLVAHLRPSEDTRKFGRWLNLLFFGNILFGVANLSLHAPLWMQLAHLLAADATWITLILFASSALAVDVPQVEHLTIHQGVYAPEAGEVFTVGWKDYLALTKPRVISLLLFTTLAAMFIATRHAPGFLLFLAVGVGGYMAAGAANAINMVIDRDIDGRMKRTSKRPTVTRAISSKNALRFAFTLASLSFALLWGAANLLTAMLALAGLVFYVVVYTLGLKRRTWYNIVIGGAAGAFPPLVGWASVTNELHSFMAWYLFAIIFVWTPAHFWALALLIKDDYAEAGIPMLPVVKGDRVTVIQIGFYAMGTVVLSLLPFFLHEAGLLYLIGAIALGYSLLVRSFRLYQKVDKPRASSMFHYSMIYLALLFLIMAIDRVAFRG